MRGCIGFFCIDLSSGFLRRMYKRKARVYWRLDYIQTLSKRAVPALRKTEIDRFRLWKTSKWCNFQRIRTKKSKNVIPLMVDKWKFLTAPTELSRASEIIGPRKIHVPLNQSLIP